MQVRAPTGPIAAVPQMDCDGFDLGFCKCCWARVDAVVLMLAGIAVLGIITGALAAR